MRNQSKKIKLQILSGVLALGIFTACTKKFDELNTNPNNATAEQIKYDYYSTGGYIVQMQKNVFPVADQPNYGDEVYQITQNLAGDIFSGQQGASNNFNGGTNNSTYGLIQGWYGATFERAFVGVLGAFNVIKTSVKATNPDIYAAAQIIKVEALHRTTDSFGPLPYLKVGSSLTNIPYDSQETIYNTFFKELDSAIAVLKDFTLKNPDAKPLQKYDAIYGGNYTQWVKFANSLKLRLAMRIVYANPTLARTKAEEAINDSYGVITTNADNAAYKSYLNFQINNPLYIISSQFNDTRMGATMESYLKGFNDPRLGIYFSKAASDGGYHGVRSGIIINDRPGYIAKCSAINNTQSTPIPWMSAAEVYFLRAEGAARGWNMNGTAETLYNTGVSTAFAQYNAGDATTYTNDATSTQMAYTDVVNGSNSYSAPLSTITIKWNEGDSFERKLERIITQKWIAVFPDGQEAWSEFRRTGYPNVFPVVENRSQGTISTTVQIRRLPFPQSEILNNASGVAVGRSLLGGPDNGGTKLWWDKK